MAKKKVNFFTYVDESYYHFVLPYIFSICHDTDATVEVVLQSKQDFFNIYGKRLANMCIKDKMFSIDYSDRVSIKDISVYNIHAGNLIPHIVRFLITPKNVFKSKYTYITDCDIIVTEKLYVKALENNLAGMLKNRTCFFNIKREGRDSLSGVHFVRNKEYYDKLEGFLMVFVNEYKGQDQAVNKLNLLSDEGFLFYFVKNTFGEPEKLTKDNFRILPGEHISPNRDKTYNAIFKELTKDSNWERAFHQFDVKILNLFDVKKLRRDEF